MANNIKFTGLSSGLDTESIVNAMVMPYKNKVDNSKKQETLLEWKKDAYKEVSSKVYNFYTKTASSLRLESTFNKKKVTASTNSAIELDSTSTVSSGTHTIDEIKQMANSARVETTRVLDKNGKQATTTTNLRSIGIEAGDEITLSQKVDGELVTKTIKFVNSNGDIPEHDDEHIYVALDGTGGRIAELTQAISKALPDANVSFNDTAGAFFITSKSTGQDQVIEMSAKSSEAGRTALNIFAAIGIKTSEVTAPSQSGSVGGASGTSIDADYKITVTGQDAVYSYNGIEDITSNTNNIDIGGLKFTIKDETNTPITINSTEDIDGMVKVVKDFVDEYNTLIAELNEMLDADSAKGYEPLTDEEKEAMSESQIEKWETKIKDSLLRNDSTLENLLTSMRSALGGTVAGNEFKSLSGIGITTGSYTENGKLYLDEDKLKKALSKNADAVVQLLAGSGDAEAAYYAANPDNGTAQEFQENKAQWEQKTLGLFDRTYNVLKSNFNSITNVKSSTSLFNDLLFNKTITNQAEETDKWQERYDNAEERYYAQYTAMEKMMSQLNSQTSSITALLGQA